MSTEKTVAELDRECREMSVRDLEWAADLAPKQPVAHGHLLTQDERLGQRAVNELSRRKWQAERQAEESAKNAARQAAADAAAEQQNARLKGQYRVAFPGTAAEFEKQWPAMLAEHQRRTAHEQTDRVMQAARERLAGLI